MPNGLQKFGRYTLTERIARGGMGEIYRATLEGVAGFEKQCVIKKILPDLASDDTFIERFLNEGRTLVALTHSNIVQIFDMGEVNGEYYLAMEYIAGADLRFLLKQIPYPSQLPIDIAIAITLETLKGLRHAHLANDKNGIPLNIVHRDISPSNILISENGEVKIIDFGIAKARTIESCTGLVQGKFAYMSPEQARGESLDARTDIFSLGIVLYEMLTNVRPFEGSTDLQCLEYVKSKEHAKVSNFRKDIDDTLETIIQTALAKDKAHRFQSADSFYDALDDYTRVHGYKADQRTIQHYFKSFTHTEVSQHAHAPSAALDDVLDAMLNAQALNATLTRTQTITPENQRINSTTPSQALEREKSENIDPGLEDTLLPAQPLASTSRETQELSNSPHKNTDGNIPNNISTIPPEESKQAPTAPSHDTVTTQNNTQKWIIALLLACICLIFAIHGLYVFFINPPASPDIPQDPADIATQPSPTSPDTEPPHLDIPTPKHWQEIWMSFVPGVPFVFQTTPSNATIYVIEGNYHTLKDQSVVLQALKNVEIAIQAPGYDTCRLRVLFSPQDPSKFNSLDWKNCTTSSAYFSLPKQRMELTAALIPIRAARNEAIPTTPQIDSQPSVAQDDTKSPSTPQPKQRIKRTQSPKQPHKTQPTTHQHELKSNRAASAWIHGTSVPLPTTQDLPEGTKIKIQPKVTGKTVAIAQNLTWSAATPAEIAFCDVKIRIRESYVPGDPLPYQIADIAIDGKTIAKQTDFVALVLPCGTHTAEAHIQAGQTRLQTQTQFTVTPDKALTLPLTLKP